MKNRPPQVPRRRADRKPTRGYLPIPHYKRYCGWCARTTQVVSNKYMHVCGDCGH
jgi:hypothetical protein